MQVTCYSTWAMQRTSLYATGRLVWSCATEPPVHLTSTLQIRICTLTISICTLKMSICTLKMSIYKLKTSICTLKMSICTLKASICTLKISICTLKISICALRGARARGSKSLGARAWEQERGAGV